MELVHVLVIIALVVIVLLGLILFRINTHIQMRVSFNMDDECNIYNQYGLAIFIKKHLRKLANPTLVVIDIKNLMMIYKLQEEKKEFMIKLTDYMLKGLKPEETLARLAFNKFCILYNNRKREEIQGIGKEFEKIINSSKFEYNLDIQYRISYGVYENPDFKNIQNDLRDAEASIRHSKIKDKNFYYFSPDVTNYLVKRDTINASKKGAYDEKRIISYIQPKVSLKTGRVCGGEILCRWVDEQYKPIYFPDEFIPVFEENGFVKQVDMLMLANACQLVQTLIRRGNDDIVISVNLSKANFESENCIQKILDVVNQYDVPHQNIEFEVTETAIMNSPAYVSDEIMQIRQLGFKVAMDDFGKEYSSLGSLSDNPYDTIKLDGIFFKNGLTVDKERHIAENLITMLSKLNVEIVCEGVEDKDTVDYIGSVFDECVIQGYVFSKPIPLNQFEAFLDTQYDFEFEHREAKEEFRPQIGFKKSKYTKTTDVLSDERVKELEEKINQMQQALAQAQPQQGYPYGYPNQPQQGYPYGYPNQPQQGYPYGYPNQPQQGYPYGYPNQPQQGYPYGYPSQAQGQVQPQAQPQVNPSKEEEVKPAPFKVTPIRKTANPEPAKDLDNEEEKPKAKKATKPAPKKKEEPSEELKEEKPIVEDAKEEITSEAEPVENKEVKEADNLAEQEAKIQDQEAEDATDTLETEEVEAETTTDTSDNQEAFEAQEVSESNEDEEASSKEIEAETTETLDDKETEAETTDTLDTQEVEQAHEEAQGVSESNEDEETSSKENEESDTDNSEDENKEE